jgi:hypothetical protein
MRTFRHRTGVARAGLTLVEMTIAGALFVLLASSAILAANGGYGAFRTTRGASDVESRLRRALDRVAFELLSAGVEELQPDPEGQFGTDDVLFRQVVGLNGTVAVWGDQNRLGFEYESDEDDNGVDDNGDGLVDEGLLVLTRDVGGVERRLVLCRGVSELLEGETADGDDDNGNGVIDEAGFNVHREGEILYLRLTVVEPDPRTPIVRTLETSVRLRN